MTTTMDTRSGVQNEILNDYRGVRRGTLKLVESLSAEDCTTQSMPDASPAKWHLAHTTWFFERLVIEPRLNDYQRFDSAFHVLFNSYYNSLGVQYPRPRRGVLSRPSLDRVLAYRDYVDRHMQTVLEAEGVNDSTLAEIVQLGLNHEQQHQELLLTDVKHLFSCNPLKPAYSSSLREHESHAQPLKWAALPEGLRSIGHDPSGNGDFAFDNESPRHRVFVEAFDLANRLVTNREYLDFMDDGGYDKPELWLSDGWATIQSEMWKAPMYWEERDGSWMEFTLGGLLPLDLDAPVCHVSYFEADAYARWAGARLPSEAEWETASSDRGVEGNFVESGYLRPIGARDEHGGGLSQLYGDVWEWTKSGYEPYPGYRTPAGPLGEYNSKFMCSQLVLRGGSCATPKTHIRNTYRNFFPPNARWQFSGIRLCKDGA